MHTRRQRNYAIPPAQKNDAREALEILAGTGIDLATAARLAVLGKRPAVRVTVEEAIDRFMRSRQSLRGSSLRWYDTRLSRLRSVFRGRGIDGLTRQELRAFVDAVEASEATRCSYTRAVRALWHWCARQEPPLVLNDVSAGLPVVARKPDNDGAEFLSVEAVGRIMENVGEFRSAAALLFFAGIRPHEIHGQDKPPLRWASIREDERIVRIPAEVAKTRKSRILEGLPDALWNWLDRAGAKDDESICPTQSQNLMRRIQAAGGYAIREPRTQQWRMLKPWPHDGTRHSFASYALALTSDPARVALWLGHESSPTMLYRHYRGLATKAEAEAYFGLFPAQRGANAI